MAWAIQLAKHIGATVATTTSTSNVDLVKSLGADVVIDYKKDDFEKVLNGYDVVLNSLGKDALELVRSKLKAMTSEIDRYSSWPGQACGYKVGHTETNRLRERAKAKLGARYDLRAYDDLVVSTGAVPLTILGNVVDSWIAWGGQLRL